MIPTVYSNSVFRFCKRRESTVKTHWEQPWIEHGYFLKAQTKGWRLLMHHRDPKEWPVNICWVLKSIIISKIWLGSYVMTLKNWSSGIKWWTPFLWIMHFPEASDSLKLPSGIPRCTNELFQMASFFYHVYHVCLRVPVRKTGFTLKIHIKGLVGFHFFTSHCFFHGLPWNGDWK